MADLTRPYVLKRHRRLPVDQQPVAYLLDPSAEEIQALREELAVPSGAAPDGSSAGPGRAPVDRVSGLEFSLRQAARYVRRFERMHGTDGAELSLAGLDEAARVALFRRALPARVVNEYAGAMSDLDKEEERLFLGSAAT
jgi:hypothetical protein